MSGNVSSVCSHVGGGRRYTFEKCQNDMFALGGNVFQLSKTALCYQAL